MTGRKGLAVWLAGWLAGGCLFDPGPPAPAGAVGDDGRQVATLAVNVRAGLQPVAGAVVEFAGAGLAPLPTQTTGADGAVAFVDVDAHDRFVIRAEAPGYVPTARTTDELEIRPGTTVPVTLTLPSATGLLQGRVLSAGRPLAGAVVSDGRHSTETDPDGRFRLATDRGMPVLKIAATGHAPKVIGPLALPSSEALGELALAPRPRPLQVLVDGGRRPFGSDQGDDRLQAFYSLLASNGCEVKRLAAAALGDLSQIDVLVVPVPSTSYDPDELAAITDWVLEGGKLVVLGEWGGFAGFDVNAANDLLRPFNLAFGADALRASAHTGGLSDVLRLGVGVHQGLFTGVGEARFYQAASVRAVDGGTVPLDPHNTRLHPRLDRQGMRIASIWGQFSPLATSLAGAGRVVAIGDASLFTNEDSDGDGTMNLLSGDNRTLAWNVIRF